MALFYYHRFVQVSSLVPLALLVLTLRSPADDQIVKKDGTVLTGQILGVSNGTQVIVSSHASNGSLVKLSYPLNDFQTVSMAPPAAIDQVKGATAATVVSTLEPLVKQFAGLPADWVVDAMAHLAEADAEQGQVDKALAIYNEIDTLYPGSKYHPQAVAGRAKMSLKQGKIDEALTAVQPVIDDANKNLAPSPADGSAYANAFLVYGQVLEAQKKPQQALEAYLTVTTMYYQNPALVEQAQQLAKNLRDQNPGIGVD